MQLCSVQVYPAVSNSAPGNSYAHQRQRGHRQRHDVERQRRPDCLPPQTSGGTATFVLDLGSSVSIQGGSLLDAEGIASSA